MDASERQARRVFAETPPELSCRPSKQTMSFLIDAEKKALARRSAKLNSGRSDKKKHRANSDDDDDEPLLLPASDSIAFGFVPPSPKMAKPRKLARAPTDFQRAEGFKGFGSCSSLSRRAPSMAGFLKSPRAQQQQHASSANLSKFASSYMMSSSGMNTNAAAAAATTDPLAEFSEVLRHDPKHVSVYERPKKLRQLDRELAEMAVEVERETLSHHHQHYSRSPPRALRRRSSFSESTASSSMRTGGGGGGGVNALLDRSARRKSLAMGIAENKPPLQICAWAKHIPYGSWAMLSPRTRHLAETAAKQDVEAQLDIMTGGQPHFLQHQQQQQSPQLSPSSRSRGDSVGSNSSRRRRQSSVTIINADSPYKKRDRSVHF